MTTSVSPSRVSGPVQAPASKSSMQRACAASLVAGGHSTIRNPGHSNDDLAAIGIIRDLGCTVTENPGGTLTIESRGVDPRTDSVHCGESGLSIRMFTPIVALSGRAVTIEGEGSLLGRPMDFFDLVLPALGVSVQSNQGKLPLRVRGPLRPADISTDGSLSSQFLTGLLMAYAGANASGVSIRVDDLKSRPYIDLTLKVMRDFGLKVPENHRYERFFFSPDAPAPGAASREYTVEGDWSGGAFLLVASALAGPLDVLGLDPQSTQADRAILAVLPDSGAAPAPFRFDATDCPDLFPPLVALAAGAVGDSMIRGVSRLAHKESNRALTLQREFGTLGVTIDLNGDEMRVRGTGRIRAAEVDSHGDHRIAMACAVAGLIADGPVSIRRAEAVGKSYPDFFDDLRKIGASINQLTSTH